MAELNIEINQNSNGFYTEIHPATEASLISYTNTTLGSNVTNVKQALIAIYNALSPNLPKTTTYDKVSTNYRTAQLERKVSGSYVPIRIHTKAEQVRCYSPITGQETDLKTLLDDIVSHYIN